MNIKPDLCNTKYSAAVQNERIQTKSYERDGLLHSICVLFRWQKLVNKNSLYIESSALVLITPEQIMIYRNDIQLLIVKDWQMNR